jgi:hypothetical protein
MLCGRALRISDSFGEAADLHIAMLLVGFVLFSVMPQLGAHYVGLGSPVSFGKITQRVHEEDQS